MKWIECDARRHRVYHCARLGALRYVAVSQSAPVTKRFRDRSSPMRYPNSKIETSGLLRSRLACLICLLALVTSTTTTV